MSKESGQPELESRIAESVCSYIKAVRSPDSPNEPEALRWLCAGLERLLRRRLEGREGWNGWVDGVIAATDILPDAIQVISAVEVNLRGYATWAKVSRGPFWIEPFFGIVRLSETDHSIAGYELYFADAVLGFGRVPYGKHIRWEAWFLPNEWLYKFSKG
jgi:hypothetical protein